MSRTWTGWTLRPVGLDWPTVSRLGRLGLDYSSAPHPSPPHVGGGNRCVSSWPRFGALAGSVSLCVLCGPPILSFPSDPGKDRMGRLGVVCSSTPHPIPPHVGGGNRCVLSWPRFGALAGSFLSASSAVVR